ncbi:MAG TPA: aldehyde dehydrogenase family protein [Solirubrobacter sp.]|nr:aldehyde dehydrogenase family protein [Solirubrobacter sp.]
MISVNPHRPSDVVAEFEPSPPDAVDAAVRRAAAAQPGWAARPAAERGAALGAAADELAARTGELTELIVREVGKPRTEAAGEVARAVAVARYYAQQALAADGETLPSADGHSWLLVRRRPVGVCALITPWNFPLALPLWKAAPALAWGNAVVLKPAPQATALGRLLAEVLARGAPCELVVGDAEAGRALVAHEAVAAVSFTGSSAAGHRIAAAAAGRGARVQCEMGGVNASVVLADADLEAAARIIAGAAMGYAGQKCTATSRVIVDAAAIDAFRPLLVDAIAALPCGDPADAATVVGPLIDAPARAAALDAVARAGGTVLTGGAAVPGDGFHLRPTLVELADADGVLAREEVFGPVAALLTAAGPDDALRLANGVRYGLSGAVFTRDLGRALAFMRGMDAGLVRVNAATSGVDFHAPFGGVKASSYGPREQGLAARELFTETQTMLIAA